MFEKIIFPTSGSALTEKIAQVIVGLINEKPDRQVYILNVVDSFDMPAVVAYEMERTGLSLEEISKKALEEKIELATKVFEENGVPYKVKVRKGKSVDTIVKTAEELECDLMVIGYHGECTLTEFLFKGNVMTRLIDDSHCPVMIIK